MMGRFVNALAGQRQDVPPVWFMRQAGRYQRSYQAKRRKHTFEQLCREPHLAAAVALDAAEEFDFDAAILFSDLLFPLNALGLPLSYDDGGPKLGRQLDEKLITKLRSVDEATTALRFQAEAVALTRYSLPSSKGLVGFIGGPWTLFVYAVEGTHAGSLIRPKASMALYRKFARIIVPLLERMACQQLEAGADVVMVFDTAAGELSPGAYRRHLVPDLQRLSRALPGRLGYYARGIQPAHLGGMTSADIGDWAGLGVDWRWNLADVLSVRGRSGFVQGNFDPALLHLTGTALKRAVGEFLEPVAALKAAQRRGWVCGLGHGVLPGTPESSVRDFVRIIRRRLS
jgi:uroporphyrinogen decarboxylase